MGFNTFSSTSACQINLIVNRERYPTCDKPRKLEKLAGWHNKLTDNNQIRTN